MSNNKFITQDELIEEVRRTLCEVWDFGGFGVPIEAKEIAGRLVDKIYHEGYIKAVYDEQNRGCGW